MCFRSNDAPLLSAPSSPSDLELELKRAGWAATAVTTLETMSESLSAYPLYEGELFDEYVSTRENDFVSPIPQAALVYARRHYVIAIGARSKGIVDACLKPPPPPVIRIRRYKKEDVSTRFYGFVWQKFVYSRSLMVRESATTQLCERMPSETDQLPNT